MHREVRMDLGGIKWRSRTEYDQITVCKILKDFIKILYLKTGDTHLIATISSCLWIYIYCVCQSVCLACSHSSVHMYVEGWGWFRVPSLPLSTLRFGTSPLAEPIATCFGQSGWKVNPWGLMVSVSQTHFTTAHFCVDTEIANSGPHACSENTSFHWATSTAIVNTMLMKACETKKNSEKSPR